MIFDVYANFSEATYRGEHYPSQAVFSHFISAKLSWLVNTLFSNPDTPELWG
jgi:hypothetical protein